MQEHVRCILVSDANMQRTKFVATYAKLEEQCSLLRLQEHKNSVRATLEASMVSFETNAGTSLEAGKELLDGFLDCHNLVSTELLPATRGLL